MKYHEFVITKQKSVKRVGRGIASGKGKTAGRGTKGQKSRTGYSPRPGFEGGQNPLYQRIPKLPGFRSIRVKAENVYTGQLNALGGNVDNFSLFEAGLVSGPHVNVKVIHKGDVNKKVSVRLQGASENAVASIQKSGGTFERVARVARLSKKEVRKEK